MIFWSRPWLMLGINSICVLVQVLGTWKLREYMALTWAAVCAYSIATIVSFGLRYMVASSHPGRKLAHGPDKAFARFILIALLVAGVQAGLIIRLGYLGEIWAVLAAYTAGILISGVSHELYVFARAPKRPHLAKEPK